MREGGDFVTSALHVLNNDDGDTACASFRQTTYARLMMLIPVLSQRWYLMHKWKTDGAIIHPHGPSVGTWTASRCLLLSVTSSAFLKPNFTTVTQCDVSRRYCVATIVGWERLWRFIVLHQVLWWAFETRHLTERKWNMKRYTSAAFTISNTPSSASNIHSPTCTR